jgi:hypothetical protein
MWKAAASDQLAGSCRSVHKPLRIGSMSIPTGYHLLRYPKSHGSRNWTSCTPLSSRKKRNLHPNHCGSRHPLLVELGCSADEKQPSHASLSRTCATSQTILLRCLSALRYTLLWSTLRNAIGQERNIFCGSCECRLASLLETLGSQIQMFLSQVRSSS